MTASDECRRAEARPIRIHDTAALRFPGEQWRFVLATATSVGFLVLILVVCVLQSVATFLVIAVFLFFVGASIWWVIQLTHARLLGNSVNVTAQTYPVLAAALADVCQQLDYDRRIEVYVTSKSEPQVSLITYLGKHMIVIEGDFAAELLAPENAAQLCFLLARHVGALKTRQSRLDIVISMLSAVNALQIVKPFLLPYYRSTAYSGDQIGLTCCGSLEAALEATGSLLVGQDLATQLPLEGILPQAALIRRGLLPRFAQFLSPTPHVISRYLNLLLYGRARSLPTADQACAGLSGPEVTAFEELWRNSPHRKHADLVAQDDLRRSTPRGESHDGLTASRTPSAHPESLAEGSGLIASSRSRPGEPGAGCGESDTHRAEEADTGAPSRGSGGAVVSRDRLEYPPPSFPPPTYQPLK
jgi:hypothetical protein